MIESVLLLGSPPFDLVEKLRGAGVPIALQTDGVTMEELVLTPPDVLVVCGAMLDPSVLNDMRNDLVLRRLPIFGVMPRALMERADWEKLPLDDFMLWPGDPVEAARRIELALARHARTFDVNPLSGLAGNTTILHETQRRLGSGQPFALAYIDVDNFKSFNDRYGYDRGDEVLRACCRIFATTVHDVGGPTAFLGHLGGDDFVFMGTPPQVDAIAADLIARFDAVIPSFYDDEDRERGSIVSVDRQGNRQTFPIMSISIAVVTNEHRTLSHVGEISKIASELKKKLKMLEGSNVMKDRRREHR